jgi:hypothetical protein
MLSIGGHASKSGYLFALASRQRGVLVYRRYNLGTLLAGSAASSSSQILCYLGTTFVLDRRGVVTVDLDGRATADNYTKCTQGG